MPGSDFCNQHRPDAAEQLTNRCVRRKKNGEQCRRPAVRGSTVCPKHGINRFALAAAQRRLASFADPALTALYDILIKPSTPDNERARVALAIIDRVGLGPSARFEVGIEAKPWEIVMQHVVRELPEGSDLAIESGPVVDAEVVEEPIEDEPRPRDNLPRIVPPHSSEERATYERPQRSAEPPAHLV
ncbi:hypothetical protein [Demequina zhanjiangensis]|uniref:Uncharacterized protein n=1 Tax=Demequina zhanjiangensis TaxID=3051659 RepID=A0ABT8G4D5_9MICO|nr:hypothetical protein [Demequina sp. SYSU T00b26]MDN4473569.1 hypothetical protein [Demequina sp. SYSU T00b26]